MTPTYEEMLEGTTQWRKEYKGIAYLLSHHGYREKDDDLFMEPHPGIWCYYLLITEDMFPHRWEDFSCGTLDVVSSGRVYKTPSRLFEDCDFYGGITYSEDVLTWDNNSGSYKRSVKIGCDYNHSWDRDYGYYNGYSCVESDAKKTIDKFLEQNPDGYKRCKYSGVWGPEEDFYQSVGGWWVHNSRESDISEDWDNWKRIET